MADGKTIGFYGDSFCADPSEQSWTNIISKKLNATIVNKGKNGHSIWTAILDFIKNPTPTYSIFCWTSPHRLYHPKYPTNPHSQSIDEEFDDALKKHFTFLWHEEKEILNYKWTIEYFNENILKNAKTNLIQCNCFNQKDFGSDILINFTQGKIFPKDLLAFSGFTIQDHIEKKNLDLINHMSPEKNLLLSTEIYNLINA